MGFAKRNEVRFKAGGTRGLSIDALPEQVDVEEAAGGIVNRRQPCLACLELDS